MNTNGKKRCAWLCRHEPTKAQRADLEGAGYRIAIVNPPGRITSARWAWALCQNACGGMPDLVVAVLPMNLLNYFLREVDPNTVVVRAIAQKNGEYDHDWIWSGRWERIERVKIVTKPWTPGNSATG